MTWRIQMLPTSADLCETEAFLSQANISCHSLRLSLCDDVQNIPNLCKWCQRTWRTVCAYCLARGQLALLTQEEVPRRDASNHSVCSACETNCTLQCLLVSRLRLELRGGFQWDIKRTVEAIFLIFRSYSALISKTELVLTFVCQPQALTELKSLWQGSSHFALIRNEVYPVLDELNFLCQKKENNEQRPKNPLSDFIMRERF